jgi:hypothetical protein
MMSEIQKEQDLSRAHKYLNTISCDMAQFKDEKTREIRELKSHIQKLESDNKKMRDYLCENHGFGQKGVDKIILDRGKAA